jgi:hypothetical protein
MKSSKRMKIITGSLVVSVALVIGGVFAADYAVSRVMDLFVAGLEADVNDVSQADGSTITPEPQEPNVPIKIDHGESAVKQDSSNGQDNHESEDKPASSSGSTSASTSGSTIEAGKPGGAVTKEQAEKVREKLTVTDKASVVKVVLKNLSLTDIKSMQALADGGLTLEEKKSAKRLLLGKLSSEEYDELSALAKKYGLSKGRSYEEAIKENP